MGESDVNEKNQFEMIFELLIGAKKSSFQHDEKFAPAHYFNQPKNFINSQAPDVPELAHQGIFQLSRLSVNCYVKTVKKCSLYLSRTDFLKILSVPQDHCGSHKVKKNYFLGSNFIILL